ncbi:MULTISPECIES: hypothetical protein [unclassified Pseudonocardia]|uniref:hypothetical protein n=1 Tax=unclassified Pseudonocardia TaxID=2619320 RepID=UPI0009654EED|nr:MULTISPECIES: hypothetical protein [unclassified Pseudonocardia]MBN9098082.1 hypothetical protein [Pseudonocardia sp.]OJY40275.1 MAG: hypothetical protein BGP03_00185 [Pseudonocardia sp. 73-21]
MQARPSDRELALSSYLDVLRAEHLLPLFVDVADPHPFARRGLDVHRYAAEAVLDPARFTLTSPGRRELARDVLEARDRLVVLPGCRDTPAGETWAAAVALRAGSVA